MGVTLERVQFRFASIIGELCNEPKILSQFAVWLDMRLAEFKLRGSISLDCSGEAVPPGWIEGMEEAMAAKFHQGLKRTQNYSEHCIEILEDDDVGVTDTSLIIPASSHSSKSSVPSKRSHTSNDSHLPHNLEQFMYHSHAKISKLSPATPRTSSIHVEETDSAHTDSLTSIISESHVDNSATASSISAQSNDIRTHQFEHSDSTDRVSDLLRGDNSSSCVYLEQNSGQSLPVMSDGIMSYHGEETSGSTLNLVYPGAIIPQRRERTYWSSEERRAIITNLLPIVQRTRKPPMKADVRFVMQKEPALQNRHWEKVKFQAWSMYQQMVKKQKSSSASSKSRQDDNHQLVVK